MMISCPNCGKPGITAMRAQLLGPAIPATCKECREKVAPSYWSIVISLPLLAALFLVEYYIKNPLSAFFIGIFATIAMYSIFYLFPLKLKRKKVSQNN